MRSLIFAVLVSVSSVASAQNQTERLNAQARMVEAQAKMVSSQADLISAVAIANETNAKALQGIEHARSLFFGNKLKKTETFYGKKALYENHKDLKSPRNRPSQEDLRRYSRSTAPDRLDFFEFNPIRAKIYWPALLKEDRFSQYRLQVEGLFKQYLLDDNREASIYQEIRELTDKMHAELSSLVRETPLTEYAQAKKFLRSLAYESRFPGEIDRLASD